MDAVHRHEVRVVLPDLASYPIVHTSFADPNRAGIVAEIIRLEHPHLTIVIRPVEFEAGDAA